MALPASFAAMRGKYNEGDEERRERERKFDERCHGELKNAAWRRGGTQKLMWVHRGNSKRQPASSESSKPHSFHGRRRRLAAAPVRPSCVLCSLFPALVVLCAARMGVLMAKTVLLTTFSALLQRWCVNLIGHVFSLCVRC